jgi:hypothetical protein
MMRLLSKVLGVSVVTVMMGMGLSTPAFSSANSTVQSDVQPGKTIKGKVMDVVKLDEKSAEKSTQPSWYVFVRDQETGRLVLLHVDQETVRKHNMLHPDLGENIIAQYNEQNNHAYSFLTDERDHNQSRMSVVCMDERRSSWMRSG